MASRFLSWVLFFLVGILFRAGRADETEMCNLPKFWRQSFFAGGIAKLGTQTGAKVFSSGTWIWNLGDYMTINSESSYGMMWVNPNNTRPADYPVPADAQSWILAENEAIISMICAPPEVAYFGVDVFAWVNPENASIVIEGEAFQPINHINLKTIPTIKNPTGPWQNPFIIVIAADMFVVSAIEKAFAPYPINTMVLSEDAINLIDRSKPWQETMPFAFGAGGRATLWDDQKARALWQNSTTFIGNVAAVRIPLGFHNPIPLVPDVDDKSDINEFEHQNEFETLLSNIIRNKTATGEYELLTREDLIKFTMNNSNFAVCSNVSDMSIFLDVPHPYKDLQTFRCYGATRDCVYQLNDFDLTTQTYGDGDRFFVYVSLYRSLLNYTAYHSIMVTPANTDFYEQHNHTFSLSDTKLGSDGANYYLPGNNKFIMATFGRTCDPTLAEGCWTLNETWYPRDATPYWMGRNYLNPKTGTAPDTEAQLSSVVLTFIKKNRK